MASRGSRFAGQRRWLVAGIALVLGLVFGGRFLLGQRAASGVSAPGAESRPAAPIAVKVVHPRAGAMEHVTVQPGSVQGYESVQLYAKVSGYLKTQNVDIGDRVEKDQILAVVDVPELQKQRQRNRASLEQARAKVAQMKARIQTAHAEQAATRAQIVQAEANAKTASATLRFREKQLQRMRDLFNLKSIDERIVDETIEHHAAAVEAENSAKASISTAQAQLAAAGAKIEQANADLLEAESEISVAQADLDKTEVQLDFATLKAPFNGVITRRSLFPNDFVRSAGEGGSSPPLLTIQRVDRMRVVVQVPDRDVPYTDPGDAAVVEIDALPGQKFPAQVSRIAASEDFQTRLMQVEIDLPNPKGQLRQGMFGRVTIVLEKTSNRLSVPSACLVGKTGAGKGTLFVVKDGLAHLIQVRLGTDNGVRVEVLDGVTADSQVILHPSSAVAEDSPVQATPADAAAASH